MLDIYQTLEIGRVLEEVASFSKTELGVKKISNLKMLSFEEASKSLTLLDQMANFILKYGSLPILSSHDLSTYIDMALKGGVLTPLDLDAPSLTSVHCGMVLVLCYRTDCKPSLLFGSSSQHVRSGSGCPGASSSPPYPLGSAPCLGQSQPAVNIG